MAVVTGTPLAPFADAIYARLNDDAILVGLLAGGVQASLSRAGRTNRPYVVVGSQRDFLDHGEAGAMQREGGKASIVVDVFSDFHGPEQTQDIQARIRVLLQRFDLVVPGFVLYGGSLIVDDEKVLPDFDPDMPERSGFHGVQQVTGLLEELA